MLAATVLALKLTRTAVEVGGKGKKASGGSVVPPPVGVWRCRARLPNVLVGTYLKCLMTARMLVGGSLLVKGPSSEK